MSQERFFLDGAEVARRRKKKGWTQKQMLAESPAISLRRLQDVEGDKCCVSRDTLEAIARALDCDSASLVQGRLCTWQWVPRLSDPDLERKLAQANRFDMAGQVDRAVELTSEVLDAIDFDHDSVGYASVVVRLTTFLGHGGDHARALEHLNRYLRLARSKKIDAAQLAWPEYHKGISLRRLDRFDQAERIFTRLRRVSESVDIQVAALHQLGVIDLERAKRGAGAGVARLLGEAERKFRRCLRMWERLGPTHRKGYALNRLGQVFAVRGKFITALKHFHEALVVFAWWHCQRYVDVTYEDVDRFVLRKIS